MEFSVQRDNLSLVQLEGRVTNHFDLLLNIWIDDSRDGSKKRKKFGNTNNFLRYKVLTSIFVTLTLTNCYYCRNSILFPEDLFLQ